MSAGIEAVGFGAKKNGVSGAGISSSRHLGHHLRVSPGRGGFCRPVRGSEHGPNDISPTHDSAEEDFCGVLIDQWCDGVGDQLALLWVTDGSTCNADKSTVVARIRPLRSGCHRDDPRLSRFVRTVGGLFLPSGIGQQHQGRGSAN